MCGVRMEGLTAVTKGAGGLANSQFVSSLQRPAPCDTVQCLSDRLVLFFNCTLAVTAIC